MASSPLRVLAFSGSTRQESFNNRLVRLAEAGARDAGGAVTHIDLRDYRLPLFDQDEEAANGMPENARALKQLLIDHDGLLVASPEYNSSVTAVLKNTIDWVSRPDDGDAFPLVAFRKKVVALMSASPGGLGGLRGLVHIRSIFTNLGCIVLPDQVAVTKAHEAFTVDGALRDDRQHQRVVALGKTLVETGGPTSGLSDRWRHWVPTASTDRPTERRWRSDRLNRWLSKCGPGLPRPRRGGCARDGGGSSNHLRSRPHSLQPG